MRLEELRLSLSGKYIPFVRNEAGALVAVSATAISEAQSAFLSAPEREVACIGPRGSGKTEIMMMDFLSQINRGYGADYAGIIFRRSTNQMRDLEKLLHDLITPIWPHSSYNQLKQVWTFQSKETLELRYFDSIAEFDNIQGRQFAWIGFEELQLYQDLEPFLRSFSCLRSTALPTMPRKMRFTANPLGPSHNHIKHRYRLHGVPSGICGPAITDSIGQDGKPEPARRAIFCSYDGNILLQRNEPQYLQNIAAACAGDEARLQAWVKGDWDIVSGGMFDSIFLDHGKSIFVPPFEIPPAWAMFLSYDHGSSAPYSVGFWAESNGESVRMPDGTTRNTIKGDLFRISELYGNDPRASNPDTGTKSSLPEIVKAIQQHKIDKGWRWRDPVSGKWKDRCKRAVADAAIFQQLNEWGIADELSKPVTINGEQHPGIAFEPSEKGQGSRKAGYETFRLRLLATAFPRERPGLFVFEDCNAFRRVIPNLQRSDTDNDECAKGSPDHIMDEVRYCLSFDRSPSFTSRRIPGF